MQITASGKNKMASDHIFVHLANMLTTMSPYHLYLMWPSLAANRACTLRGMLSTRVLALLVRTEAHAWRAAHHNAGTVKAGPSMPQIQTSVWCQTCSMGFISGLQFGQSTSCFARKAALSCARWGVALSETYRNFRPQMCPRDAYYRQETWSNVGGWGFQPAPPVHSSGGWHPIPWQSLPLHVALTSTTITVKQHEATLITEDIMHSVPEVPLSVRSSPHTAAIHC